MGRLLLSIWLLVSTDSILRAEEPRHDVLMREPLVMFVRRLELQPHCGPDSKIRACTAFAGRRLICACHRDGDAWRMEAGVQFIPVMYLSSPEHVMHERDHINDIRRSVESYVAELRSKRFDSAHACADESSRRSASFVSVMDEFIVQSQLKRHPHSLVIRDSLRMALNRP